jgi:hypothetical protein
MKVPLWFQPLFHCYVFHVYILLSIVIRIWISVVSLFCKFFERSLFCKFWFIWVYALRYPCIFLSASHVKLHFRHACYPVIENAQSFAPESTCFLAILNQIKLMSYEGFHTSSWMNTESSFEYSFWVLLVHYTVGNLVCNSIAGQE